MMGRRSLVLLLALLIVLPLAASPSWERFSAEETITVAKGQKRINAERLWWESTAYEKLGKTEQAYLALHLYLAMTPSKDPRHNEASLKLAALAFQTKRYAMTLSLLDQATEVDETLARYGYQAALALGRTEKAQQLFSTYLKGTVSPVEYLSMLHGGNAPVSDVLSQMDGWNANDVLKVLLFYQNDELAESDAALLLEKGQSIEGTAKDQTTVYQLLQRFANQAGQRVLARKYQTLSGGNGK
ncbi:MAG: hypothetical protein LKE39_09565 [Sphaerochaeta sp.]|jgi:hypothetical protein|nr:hypothetical protein [Sphaerochaeta sp.]MCH3920687.1 hypothetical protein [Sphaerochaeta sp.]